ncbi:hypothetical protein Ais01nite_46640 [Asanoa ishikariensis]|uniref:Uncharacterized protein n=1 Tax=Asanoa ishikariensis TaxID=137265 RepID=A0A1H3S052_9ACTN|nr:hypothetical protein [Asanoa ishikariensis]GIF66629.1 hypothetical protein Ais01nite_46640 [Asanoa ishikariensis]SDZ31413.1 hypothetical protein SAMN05421684_4419 [Asanoa ishikariensis]
MSTPQPPYQPQPPYLPPAPKKRGPLVWILGSVAAFMALCIAGVVGIAVSADPDTAKTPDTPAGRAAAAAPSSAAAEPEATAAPEASAPAPPPTPKDITMTGRGDKLLKPKLDPERAYVAVISHTGGSNFIVTSIDSAGDQVDLLVNEIGRYSGTRPIGLREGEGIAALKVEAGGTWKIVLRDLSKAPQFKGKVSGKGSAVYLIPPGTLDALASAKITHNGRGNFIVTAYGERSDLLINEIGKYSGEVLLDSETLVLEIQADGGWTIQAT